MLKITLKICLPLNDFFKFFFVIFIVNHQCTGSFLLEGTGTSEGAINIWLFLDGTIFFKYFPLTEKLLVPWINVYLKHAVFF